MPGGIDVRLAGHEPGEVLATSHGNGSGAVGSDAVARVEEARAGPRERADALADFLDSWEAEHGSLSPEELAAAAARLHVALPAGGPLVR